MKTGWLVLALILLLVFACAFVPGFFGYIMESLRCMDATIQCVRVVQ